MDSSSSTHPAANSSQAAQSSGSPIHKRTYQACQPCRQRKVRCDLGPVDEPHEPPCVRCRRESKECTFSTTRRKRKADGVESDLGEDDVGDDDYAARNGRKSSRTGGPLGGYETVLHDPRRSLTSGTLSAASPLDGYSLPGDGQFQQPRSCSADNVIRRSDDGQDQEVANETAAALFQTPINIPGDALHLLLKASNESEEFQRKDTANLGRRPTSHPVQGSTSTHSHPSTQSRSQQPRGGQHYMANIDPAIRGSNAAHRRLSLPAETIKLWSRLRFVRAGWFTAHEAISYIEYFYEYLNPLTPISLPAYRPDTGHSALLNDEPMLTVTLLTIASRYKRLTGPGGQTRSFKIHEQLWAYLQGMVSRMFWGQEQFGGGFCGAGRRKSHQTNSGKGGLRSLGTIESLLLLNEYHPRSMHFPPTDDDDDILAAGDDELANGAANNDWNGDSTLGGWSEPAVRSDRMCWSLIGMSYVLAYELGIFGNYADGILPVEQRVQRASSSPTQHLREDRVERALYIFATQASGRFGLPSMYSDHVNRFNVRRLQQGSPSVDSSLLPESVDKSQQCWVDLMSIMKATNEALFSSIDQTAALIQSGEYMGRLDQLQPLLRAWHQRFENLEVEKHPRMIISIEYHYISLYINSLALQAVVEQWTTKVNATPQVDSPASPASSISSSFASIYSKNERYIKEVIDSSRTVLRHVVEGFLPGDYLKHAPVRTFFRIVAAAMFLLKTFALGAKAGEVSISLQLLNDTAKALRTSYVDDVHLCLRIADLLEGLIKAIRPKFVRLPPRPQEQQTQYTSNDAFNTQNRFQYRPNPADTTQNPLAGISRTYKSPSDSNITIMPPLGNTYIPNSNYNFSSPSVYSPNQQQNQQSYAMNNNNNNNNNSTNTTDFPMSMEEDWLTLDLNALLGDPNNGNGDPQWYGAFGPETQNSLDVLGKFMSDQSRSDGYGDGGGMGF